MTISETSSHGVMPDAIVTRSVGGKDWKIAREVPVALVYNRRNYAVLMASPLNMEDLAIGFSLTERVISSIDELNSVDIRYDERGIELRLSVNKLALNRIDTVLRRRNLVSSASCGLCGLDNVDTLFRVLPKVNQDPFELDPSSVKLAADNLKHHQPLNEKTRSVHAAAWVTHSGKISMVREDVGRHNALDKLLGALTSADTDQTTGFVLMSSRCSYEIIEKAAICGVRAVVSISAPTSFALEKAREANLSVYNISHGGLSKLA